jgi:hypothetical protein
VFYRGYHTVGYFSKEKESAARYNLACILTLPCHQRKGYGSVLISLSYQLSLIEKKLGSPEKPISDLGRVSYLSYWSSTLTRILVDLPVDSQVSISELARQTSIEPDDIIDALKHIKVLVYYRDSWVLSASRVRQFVDERRALKKKLAEKRARDNQPFVAEVRPQLLRWTPYLLKPGTNTFFYFMKYLLIFIFSFSYL